MCIKVVLPALSSPCGSSICQLARELVLLEGLQQAKQVAYQEEDLARLSRESKRVQDRPEPVGKEKYQASGPTAA